jgi:hypothetical protein
MNILPCVYAGAAAFTSAEKAEFSWQQTLQRAFPLAFHEAGQKISDLISARSVEFIVVHVAEPILSPGGACDDGVILA